MRWSKLWILIRINLKVTFGFSAWLYYFRKRDRRFWGGLGIFAAVLAGVAPLFYFYLLLLQETAAELAGTGWEGVIITSGAVLASALVFFLGLVYVISAFYFADDLDRLISMPFKPAEILGGKFFAVLFSEYLTIAPFFIPTLLVYGLQVEGGLLYWFFAIIIYLLLPVIPLIIASLGTILLMSITNLSRNKDLLRILGMVLLVVVLLGFNYLVTRLPEGGEMEFMLEIMQEPEGMISITGRAYPPSIWITEALTAAGAGDRLLNLGLFAGVSLLGLLGLMVGADRLFFPGLIGGQEITIGGKVKPGLLQKKVRSRSPVLSIALREIKILIRVPIYLFNSILILIIAPVALFFPLLLGMGGVNIDEYIALIEPDLLKLGGAGFFALLGFIASALSSSISREGKLFRISQQIPVHPNYQVLGKLISGLLISLLIVPIIILAAIIIFPWSPLDIIIICLLGLLLSVPLLAFSLLIDLLRPYFNWQNPQQAIKQNINVLIAMVGGFLILLGLGYVMVYLLERGLGINWIFLLTGIGAGLAGLIFLLILFQVAPRRYRDISL